MVRMAVMVGDNLEGTLLGFNYKIKQYKSVGLDF